VTNDLQWWSDQASRAPLLTPAQEIILGTAIQDWLTHPDGRDQCPEPIRRRGLRARDRLVTSNLRLALKFSHHWRTRVRACDMQDLISQGNLGLIDAAERFQPAKGYKFSTYARWWVRVHMDAWCNQRAMMIRPPTTQAPLMHQIRVATRNHGADGVTREQLAGELGLKPERLAEVLERDQLQTVASFDANWRSDDDGCSMAETIAAPDQAPDDSPDVARVRAALARLDTRTAQVLEALHGIDQPAVTPAEFAAVYGMRPTLVRQIAASGQAQLRELLRAATTEPAPRHVTAPAPEDFYQPEVMVFAFLLEPSAEQVPEPCRSRIVRRSRVRLCHPELFEFAG
jgi:RNA polymerase primary sigma factor